MVSRDCISLHWLTEACLSILLDGPLGELRSIKSGTAVVRVTNDKIAGGDIKAEL